ncbi:uncharacterized protein LOC133723478 [Rosa rugosa]|uniref:uncharacterized protein LOC133723478 n=1 Tax=Rosa rugosa TaxID=74645 RepID=UPI002B400455|nr:uncharacterized protein LOC133723478 [Rosa rugosa]
MRRGGGGSSGNYRNPCLTMHQPWASLLVYGIKRIEGRSWPAPIRGRLWIHAAGKVPEEATIKAMEDFYREIYAVDGVTDIKFPQHYPVSRLLGCVEVVGCVRREELAGWEMVPEGVRLEAQTDMCWLCEQPQKLLIPFEMRGYQGVYNLEKKIYEAAIRGLTPVEVPLPVKFPLPNPEDPFSLKPGSISANVDQSRTSEAGRSSSLNAAIAGARAAATQFSKKPQTFPTTSLNDAAKSVTVPIKSESFEGGRAMTGNFSESSNKESMTSNNKDQISSHNQPSSGAIRPHPGAPSKIYEAAIRGLTPVEVPLKVKFPVPNPEDPFSLKPGFISANVDQSRTSEVVRSSSLNTAIAGAQAADTQFSKKAQTFPTTSLNNAAESVTVPIRSESSEVGKVTSANFIESSNKRSMTSNNKDQISRGDQPSSGAFRPHPGAPSKYVYERRRRRDAQF